MDLIYKIFLISKNAETQFYLKRKGTVKLNTKAEDIFGSRMKEAYTFSFITIPE